MTNRGIRLGYIGLVLLWLLVLFIRPLQVDELEHAHVAWLEGVEGLVPLQDFFQHHTPLLWDLLKSYYLFGGEGPGVIYFGRVLIILAAAATFFGLRRLGMRGRGPFPAGAVGVVFFVFATMALQSLFVIRAETIATPLLVWSLVLWMQPSRWRIAPDLLSGLLFGLAVFASPRFVLLGGMFLYPMLEQGRWLTFDLRRLLILGLGSLVSVCAYLLLSGMSISELRFIIDFSALLQRVGKAIPFKYEYLYVAGMAGFLLWRLCSSQFKGDAVRPLLLDLAHLVLVTSITVFVAGKYPYHHAMAPVVLLVTLLLMRAQMRFPEPAQLRDLYYGGVLATWVFVVTLYDPTLFGGVNLLRNMDDIQTTLAGLPDGESVLLLPRRHPISVPDASYYVRPLPDDPGRLCRAVALSGDQWSLPDCDYLADIKAHRPYLVTRDMGSVVEGAELKRVMAYLDEHYVATPCFYVRRMPGVDLTEMRYQKAFSSCVHQPRTK